MIPGNIHPLMMATGGDPLDELGKIERAVRLRPSAGAYFNRVMGVATDRKKWALNVDIKECDVATQQCLFEGFTDTGNHEYIMIAGRQIDWAINVATVNNSRRVTNRVLRDPIGHRNLHFAYDSTQATASLRMRVWVDGVEETSFASAVNPALNYTGFINAALSHDIGRYGNNSSFWNGLIASYKFVDGNAPGPEFFYQFHPLTRQWRPKSKAAIRAAVATLGGPRNGWGANGCFLPFDDGSSTTTLGYDRSQSDTDTTGNNWTATNISVTAGATMDWLTDTPTNNFCTLNPLDNRGGALAPSDGNLKQTHPQGGYSCPGSFVMKTGKYWWEMGYPSQGTANHLMSGILQADKAPTDVGSFGVYWYSNTGYKLVNGVTAAYGATFSQGDVAGFYLDADNLTLECFKQTGGVGAFVSQGVISIPASQAGWKAIAWNGSSTLGDRITTWNFGQQTFNNTSIPAGCKTQSTKNLPFPTIPNPSQAFVSVTDTGANVQATLAAAAPWSSWIRIYKRQDPTAEGWRWQFSDDAANYLDSSSTAAKSAFPALGGTSYVAYALKVAAANGIATGRLSHVNGVADVVTDGLANSRKMVILVNEAGSNWFVYHPDLTAGKLLYLNLTNAETVDTTISSVTSTGFTVAAALATGTYRWIVFSEVEGFLKLWKYIANGTTDNAYVQNGLSVAAAMIKNIGAATNWALHDNARNQSNPSNSALHPNTTAGNDVGNSLLDLDSNGFKVRAVDGSVGTNAVGYVGISIGQAFRYANAR